MLWSTATPSQPPPNWTRYVLDGSIWTGRGKDQLITHKDSKVALRVWDISGEFAGQRWEKPITLCKLQWAAFTQLNSAACFKGSPVFGRKRPLSQFGTSPVSSNCIQGDVYPIISEPFPFFYRTDLLVLHSTVIHIAISCSHLRERHRYIKGNKNIAR